jgi:hypothetical protein
MNDLSLKLFSYGVMLMLIGIILMFTGLFFNFVFNTGVAFSIGGLVSLVLAFATVNKD